MTSAKVEAYLEDRHKQLISSVLLPPKLVQTEAAQQLQVWPAIGELVLVLVHLGVLVGLDDGRVGEAFWDIPVLAQACRAWQGGAMSGDHIPSD